jgi:hypothetical protein
MPDAGPAEAADAGDPAPATTRASEAAAMHPEASLVLGLRMVFLSAETA